MNIFHAKPIALAAYAAALAWAGAALGEVRVESSQTQEGITGEVHAMLAHPFEVTAAALKDPANWCEILMLHLDTKECHVASDGAGTLVSVGVVRNHDQPASSAHRVTFTFRRAEDSARALQLKLDADTGPLGTSNYRIVVEAAPSDGGRTAIRMSYAYSYGVVARIAMQAYLATFGRHKVGFTLAGHEPDGEPRYIGGMRGVVERNTMRYYLAVEAYLDALSAPPGARVEKSLRNWYEAIERYPRQLHEMRRDDYLAMKRLEFASTIGPAAISARSAP